MNKLNQLIMLIILSVLSLPVFAETVPITFTYVISDNLVEMDNSLEEAKLKLAFGYYASAISNSKSGYHDVGKRQYDIAIMLIPNISEYYSEISKISDCLKNNQNNKELCK